MSEPEQGYLELFLLFEEEDGKCCGTDDLSEFGHESSYAVDIQKRDIVTAVFAYSSELRQLTQSQK